MLKTNVPNHEFLEETKQAYSLVKSSQILVICKEGFILIHKVLINFVTLSSTLQPSVTVANQTTDDTMPFVRSWNMYSECTYIYRFDQK